ncbi:MAG TPA: M1 family aminopeptidase [Pyrinomonadaceae bacterium]|nr:M1 family aminopeptidase [Pyrinomonadaceae bacterium]
MLTTSSRCRTIILLALMMLCPPSILAQDDLSAKGKAVYDQIREFSLTGGSVPAQSLVIKRDRVEITFNGTFYFSGAVDGRVTGAVFVGNGRFSADVPPGDFEKANVKRLLGADVIESDFKTAVLRFTDNTFEEIAKAGNQNQSTNEVAQRLAKELDARVLKETGANLSARLALSMLNQEKPGFFFANFDGGRRGRFSFVLDYQNRIPVSNFDLNAGEKGLVYKYKAGDYENEIWTAFFGLDDYAKRSVTYSDVNDLIDVSHYNMELDLREHKKAVRLRAVLQSQVRFANLRAISLQIGDDLSEFESWRLKKQLRLKQVKQGQSELASVQEDWEGGFTVFLSTPTQLGQPLELEMLLEGDFLYDAETVPDSHYPRSTTSWFPRHGYLDRATFDLTFHHPKRLRIASVGKRLSEEPDAEDKNLLTTKYRMEQPVPLVTFALAKFERHPETVKWEKGDQPMPLEFNSMPGSHVAIKEDFILAELSNSVRYFTLLFGKYPYPVYGGAFHPFGFGQGFPTLIMIPDADRASKFTYVFIAHETAHQWWGNIVAWRSYRDQWLSEGFAEYSGILYTGVREGTGARNDLLGLLRSSLKDPPITQTGVGKGRLVDVGPIILGHRLSTRKTQGAYGTLIYNKGALVLRMLHFLLTDPSSGDDRRFFDMMTDFVGRYRDRAASTDDFRGVANEHFAKSPIGIKYKLDNLDWFFRQWVLNADMPSYEFEYSLQDQPDGKVLLTGTVTQKHVPESWFMVLPVVMSFGGNQEARGTVHAYGPSTKIQIRLPARPKKISLDPDHWIIAENTSTKGN